MGPLALRRRALLASSGSLLAAACAPAWSQTPPWPSRGVRIVVPYTPGGGIDVVARLLAQKLTQAWNQPVIVENRPGAGATLGTGLVAKSPPDGYSLVIVSNTFALGASSRSRMPYEPRDFAPVMLATRAPFVLGVHPGAGVRSVQDLLALARSRPGGLNFASSGAGTSSHLAIELLKRRTGIPALHVPYKGSNPAMLDLVEGRVDALFATPAAIMPLASENKLLALATTGRTRSPSAPAVPTMIEAGVADYEVVVWFGLLAPAGTPPAVLRRFHADASAALKAPDMQDKLKVQGQEVVAMGPDEFGSYLQQDIASWADIVRQIDLRFE